PPVELATASFFWHMRIYHHYNSPKGVPGAWGRPREFIKTLNLPDPISPQDGEQTLYTPCFSWHGIQNALSYDLAVAHDGITTTYRTAATTYCFHDGD